MNTQHTSTIALFLFLGGSLAGVATLSGCSGRSVQSEQFQAAGPTILNPRTQPGKISLNRDLTPTSKPEVLADVKDFHSPITEVKFRLREAPIEVSMENVGGTTYRAQLTPKQLQLLAVSGKTVQYTGEVIAKNQAGQTSTSKEPVVLKVEAPELSQTG